MAKLTQQDLDAQVVASEEFQKTQMANKLNWLRAGVLGANDGIMSTSGIVMGIAGSPNATSAQIILAGVAALVAGSISMAGGEYTSVSAQRDSEIAALAKERQELAENPEAELRELTFFYEQKGLSFNLAQKVAEELTAKDALKAHAEAELGIDSEEQVSPTSAALSSFVSFAGGSILPLLAISTAPAIRIWLTLAAVVFSLTVTGFVGAKIGGAKPGRAIVRNLLVSLATMGITYGIGHLVGSNVA
jgi:VIT1/CCC1 family predicted Fe2+/Mn2+ transporter